MQVTADRAIVVTPPLRVVFSVDKNTKSSLNKMTVKIYNLSRENREALLKDEKDKKKIGIELKVGYKGNIQRIFNGSVHSSEVTREGSDIIIALDCLDGGYDFRYSYTSKCVKGDPVDALLADMPNTTRGKITANRPKKTRPTVLVGNSYKLVGKQLQNQSFFIDDGALHVMNDDEVISEFVPVLQASTGLISVSGGASDASGDSTKTSSKPATTSKGVTILTMMNPTLKVNGLCELKSTLNPNRNKVYKITAITYAGDLEGTNWTQNLTVIEAGKYKVI